MFLTGLSSLPFTWMVILLVSFWPWEKDLGKVKKTSLEIPSEMAASRVRVALFYEKKEINLSIPASFEIQELKEETPLAQGASLPVTAVRFDASGIRMGGKLYEVPGLRIVSGNREIQVNNRNYRDVIQVLKNPMGSLTVVNELDLEDYLKGVLPSEMNAQWPEEALKAQAVASRTYAVFKNIENQDFPFALSADVASQVYRGKASEHPAASRAVDKTKGEILVYRGKVFPAFFHSTCGGRTTRADYQWKVESHPSLQGIECTFCRGSNVYAWKADFTAPEIQSLLSKKKYPVSGIKSIAVEDIDLSGRPRFFSVKHTGGKLSIQANDFRVALGADRFKSTKVRIDREGGRFIFTGRGWGHGVGLCQYGAKRLAELGYGYEDILRYYYPDSEIRRFNEMIPAHAVPSTEAVQELPKKDPLWSRWYHTVKTYVEEF